MFGFLLSIAVASTVATATSPTATVAISTLLPRGQRAVGAHDPPPGQLMRVHLCEKTPGEPGRPAAIGFHAERGYGLGFIGEHIL